MDSIFKSIGDTLNVVGKAIIPQVKKDDKENKQVVQIQPVSYVAVLGWNNGNLKPKGEPTNPASTGIF